MKLEAFLKGKKKSLVQTISSSVTVMEAGQKLASENIGLIVVVDDGKLVGVVSERDIVDRVLIPGLDLEKTLVKAIMTPNPMTCKESDTLAHALGILCVYGFRHLPVLNDFQIPVSVFTERDVISHLVKKGIK